MLKRKKKLKDSQTVNKLFDRNIRKSEFQWSFIRLNSRYDDEIIKLFEKYYDILSNKQKKELKRKIIMKQKQIVIGDFRKSK